ncbi:MAG: hypothetical protein K6E54_11035 [Bacteroidaceae bacterium]|nr:hypothetical protein [Bacteroidaceae bacterium]
MKKLVKFGIAILTLVLLGVSFLPTLFFEHGDRLVWQLGNWAWLFSSLLIAIIVVLLTIRYTKGKYILWKIMGWLCCIVLVIASFISLYIALLMHNERIWSSKEYVIYSEYRGFFDPNTFVLYKRDGFIDRRMYILMDIGFGELKGIDYSFYNDLDLIKAEVDATEFESDSVYHSTIFYRLSDGVPFEQEKNDSLLKVIKH